MLRIVIAETEDSMRRRLVQALVVERGLEVVGTAADPTDALDLVSRTRPDLVLVDLGMPDSGALLLIPAILLTLPDTVVVIRQAGSDDRAVREAFRAGAGGFLIEDGLDDHITSCIRLLTPAQVQQFRPVEAGFRVHVPPPPRRPVGEPGRTGGRLSHHGRRHL